MPSKILSVSLKSIQFFECVGGTRLLVLEEERPRTIDHRPGTADGGLRTTAFRLESLISNRGLEGTVIIAVLFCPQSCFLAIILLGTSQRPLCGKTLQEGDSIHGLPAIPYQNHPLCEFFDRGFHSSCFENWEKRPEVLELIAEAKREYKKSDYHKGMLSKYGNPKGG